MPLVQFNAPRITTYADLKAFDQRAKRWLCMREGENCYLLALLLKLGGGPVPGLNCFTIEEGGTIQMAGLVLPDHTLCATWATQEMMEGLVDHIGNVGWQIARIHAPGHVALFLAQTYARRTGQRATMERAERVYQLARNFYALPSAGHLEVATAADRPLVRDWMAGFIREAGYELEATLDALVETVIGAQCLYLWKSPAPVSMAGWSVSTPHGATINFVYTPPELRGQGYGKAVSAALGAQMLASGLRYCFILTDVKDARTHALYQAIGARTLCELTRWAILPADSRLSCRPNIVRNSTPEPT
jgi:uncharacterized protein